MVRYTLIETAWRMTRWQPDYPPIKKVRRLLSKRARRRLIVAAARRLAIDLWRLATGRASAQELGLQLQPTMTQKPSVQRQKNSNLGTACVRILNWALKLPEH